MSERYLEVTFRKGKPIAAYIYLRGRAGARSARTQEMAPGVLVYYGVSGEPIGLELTAPAEVRLGQVNLVLERLGLENISPEELAPLQPA